MFVPHGYWHMVVNLDACVALTHNYVSTSNLSDCLQFLREKTDQISGLRDRLAQGAVPPERLYDSFVEKLADNIGAEKVEQYIQQSFKDNTAKNMKRKSTFPAQSKHKSRLAHGRNRVSSDSEGKLEGEEDSSYSSREAVSMATSFSKEKEATSTSVSVSNANESGNFLFQFSL
eukprot:gene39499-53406_t